MDKEGAPGPSEGRRSRDEDYFSRQDAVASRLAPQARHMQSETSRPRLSSIQAPASPASPRTPRTPLLGRSISSTLNSPGQGIRADEDFFVVDIGSRYLRAGIGGQSQPRCELGFGPDTQLRVRDYSPWLASTAPNSKPTKADKLETWGYAHELWRLDLRGLDMGLVGVKLERSLRTAIANHLLVLDDSKKRKFMLALPATLPHLLLSTVLTAVFNVYPPPPSVVLLSCPVLCTIAAGLRSALVVDVGWASTRVTAVYEYREVKHKMSCRAMKLLSWHLASVLNSELQTHAQHNGAAGSVSFEETEQVMNRIVWCQTRADADTTSAPVRDDAPISIPLQSPNPPQVLSMPFSQLAGPPETALFATGVSWTSQDDDELPLHVLVYTTLLALCIDIREACLGRIILTGGGANIPGLKSRLINELSHMIALRGWDPVHNYGSAKVATSRRTTLRRTGATPVNEKSSATANSSKYANRDIEPNSTDPAHLQPPLPDPVLAAIKSRSGSKDASGELPRSTDGFARADRDELALPLHSRIAGKLRCVKTLGAWEGASLVAGLRVRSLVEIDREKFLQHGLQGGLRIAESKRQSMAPAQAQRQSLVATSGAAGLGRGEQRDSGAWTLGLWA